MRSARFRPIYKWFFWLLVIDCVVLDLGRRPGAEPAVVWIGQFATLYYFVHFLVILPLLGKLERPLPVPDSIDRPGARCGRHVGAAGGVRTMRMRTPFALAALHSPSPAALPAAARAAEGHIELKSMSWPTDGMFGTFDRAAVQRGFQVYREVCAACHASSSWPIRDLAGLGYTEDQIKAIAAEATVTDGPNDEGEMFERPGLPSDHIRRRTRTRRRPRRPTAARPRPTCR